MDQVHAPVNDDNTWVDVEIPLPSTLIAFCKLTSGNMLKCLSRIEEVLQSDRHALGAGGGTFTLTTEWARRTDGMIAEQQEVGNSAFEPDLLRSVLEHCGMLRYEQPLRNHCRGMIGGVTELFKRAPLPYSLLDQLGIASCHRMRLNKALSVYKAPDSQQVGTWNEKRARIQRVKIKLSALSAWGLKGLRTTGKLQHSMHADMTSEVARTRETKNIGHGKSEDEGGGDGDDNGCSDKLELPKKMPITNVSRVQDNPKCSVPTGDQQLSFLMRVFSRRSSSTTPFTSDATAGFNDAEMTQAALFCMAYRHVLTSGHLPRLKLTQRLQFDQSRFLGPHCDSVQLGHMFAVFNAADEFSNGVLTNEELEQWIRRDCSPSDGSDAAADSVFFRLLCRDAGHTCRRGFIDAGELIELLELFCMMTESELVRFAFDELMMGQEPLELLSNSPTASVDHLDFEPSSQQRPKEPCIELDGRHGLRARLSRCFDKPSRGVLPPLYQAEGGEAAWGPCSFAPTTVNSRLLWWLKQSSDRHTKPAHYHNFVTFAEFKKMHTSFPRALLPLFWLQRAFRIASCGPEGPGAWMRRRAESPRVDIAAMLRRHRRGTPYWPAAGGVALDSFSSAPALTGAALEQHFRRFDHLDATTSTWRPKRGPARRREELLDIIPLPFTHEHGWREPLKGVHPYHPARRWEARSVPDKYDPVLWKLVLASRSWRKQLMSKVCDWRSQDQRNAARERNRERARHRAQAAARARARVLPAADGASAESRHQHQARGRNCFSSICRAIGLARQRKKPKFVRRRRWGH